MSSILDIVNSVIIAGVIIALVLGIHFMTMRSSTENQVLQRMQGLADVAVTILQEEIRHLHSFASDSLLVSTNTLYFRNTDGQTVILNSTDDVLEVTKFTVSSAPLVTGTVVSFVSDSVINISPGIAMPANSMIRLSSPLGDAQTKKISDYNSDNGRTEIFGSWDMIVDNTTLFEILAISGLTEQTYNLRLIDQSPQVFTFNLRKLNPDGSDAPITTDAINAADVDLIRVIVVIASQEEELYQDIPQQFTVNLQKDFFLRGYRLPSVGG